MNLEQINRASGAVIAFVVGSVLFAVLAVGFKFSVAAPAIDADRAAERSKALAEIRAEEENCLNRPAIIDAKHGTVRLPIDTALVLAAKQWQNPSAARAELNQRADKATAAVKAESFE